MKGNVRDIIGVFSGNDRELIIPVYQRNYDWGEKQCARFYDDLVEMIRKDRPKHFFGAVVGNADGAFRWVVIDGQQRLTTTSLLMLALSNAIDTGVVESEDPELARKIRQNFLEGNKNTVSKETKLKLKPVKNDLDAYRRLIMDDEQMEFSSVTANYRYFSERIALRELTGDELWEAINRLEAMILDLEPHDDPQRIFESLNSTGKELKESDKIRNLVLMGQPPAKQEKLYEYFWNPIERNVNFDTDAFVRLYLVSRTRKTPRFDAVYEAFRKFLESSDDPVETILASMRDYSEYFRDLNSARTGVPEADTRLRRLNLLRHEVAMPTMMPLLGDYRSGVVTARDFTAAIELFDTYLFRRMAAGVQTNALNKIFATLYSEAKRLKTDDATITEVISYLLLRRKDTSGRLPEDEEFRDAFLTQNFYKFQPQNRRYLFECLENRWSKDNRAIADALQRGDLTIEHVMPQTLTRDWREALGPEAEEIHHTWLHRIGNLTITGYNSEYSNASFTTKKTLEGGFAESPFRLNNSIKTAEKWSVDEIKARNEELADVALKYWPMPHSDFEPKREPLPVISMGDDSGFTNQVIVSYEFDEVINTVGSFKEMFHQVIRQLLTSNREVLFDYASNNGLGFTVGTKGSNRYQEEVSPGLWVTSKNATNDKIMILRALFAHLDIDTDSLIFTLRPYAEPEKEEEKVTPYSPLVKFIPQFEDLVGTNATVDDIADLRADFSKEFTPFIVDTWQEVLNGRNLQVLSDPKNIGAMSVEECLAALTMLKNVDRMVPGQFRSMVTQGTVSQWLKRIDEVSEEN